MDDKEKQFAAATEREVDTIVRLKTLEMKVESIFQLLKKQKDWAEAESDLLQETRREMQKLAEVYYHVFPDRLEKDVRFEEQLRALNSSANPDANKPKS
jgi:hypothetical protein